MYYNKAGETYIRMCDCPEVQNAHIAAGGNLYASRNYSVVASLRLPWDKVHREVFIWVPYQHQSQEMLGKELWPLTWDFAGWLYDLDDDGNCDFHVRHEHEDFGSMEQLWLAFVMEEKHNKVWNGKWVDRV